jgi:hypothetical protein
MRRFTWSGITVTRARRRLLMVVNAATITVALVGWWRSGGLLALLGGGCALVGLVMAAGRPVDERGRQS